VARGRVDCDQAVLPAYFNQLAGGPSQGYLHLADSSLDWGQDLPALKQWLDRDGLQRGGGNVYLSYFGTARPEYYGIQATPLAGFIDRRPPAPPVPLGGGVYCVSATMLDVVSRLFYKPEYETNYQAAVKNATVFARASQDEQAMSSLMRDTGEEYWRQLFGDLDQLRTGRLLAFPQAAASRRDGRLLDPDLPADRCRRRAGP
jgi:hypothetical protein